jgi:heme exporter protein CcmD
MPNFDVGHYGGYIWPAYGLTLLGVAWMVADSLSKARRWKREVETREAAKKAAKESA